MNGFFANTAFAFLVVVAMSAAFTGIATWWLRRSAILDQPNARSSHSTPTPRGGGWGVMLALLPVWIWITARAGRLDALEEILLVSGAILLMAVSWVDDRRGLGPGPRFAAQIIAVFMVMATLPRDLSLTHDFLPLILDRLLAGVIWLWFLNLFNFMDGIDGLTGGSAIAMGVGVTLVSLQHGPSELDAFRGAMIAAAAAGFLLWNWHPARVFMGDVGSVPLGFLLGYELIRLAMDAALLPALILALYYLVDATVTLVRRAARGERVWRAHREHFYQRAVQAGRSHARVSKAAMGVQFALVPLALFAANYSWLASVAAAVLVGLLLRWMTRPPAQTA